MSNEVGLIVQHQLIKAVEWCIYQGKGKMREEAG